MNTKKAFLIFSIMLMSYSCSSKIDLQEISCMQIIDRNGLTETINAKEKLEKYNNTNFDQPQAYQKVLRVYNKDSSGNTISKLTCYHENGQLWKSLEIVNARAKGLYKEWHPNGNIKIQAYVIGGTPDFQYQNDWLFDGINKAYDEEGKLASEFNYHKGALHGNTTHYFQNAQTKKIIPYSNNEINGEVIEYSSNRDIISKTTYKNGIKEGQSIGYWSQENISFIEDYENNLLINGQYFQKNRVKISKIKNGDGQQAIFTNNQLFRLIEYKNGSPDGKVQTFMPNGHLINEYYQKNNLKDGIETEYFSDNEIINFNKNKRLPKLEINWSNGNIHGMVKTWYKNNNQESQKEFSNNKKNGMNFAWYENSSLMFIEEYENDILTKGSYFKINEKNPISTIIKGNGTATIFDSKGRFVKKTTYKEGSPL
ncbi:MAG: hypothetical protein ACD_79C00456G0002 [uncultured bacterium]|nr:MAG: hypothetical protein ACD_79C00456G0002 [uncultured bacterium]